MKKKIAMLSVAIVLSAFAYASAAWMTNGNHHCQVRIPNGWNMESDIIIKDDKHASILLAAPEDQPMIAAIFSMEVERQIDLKDFKAIFESMVLKNPKLVLEERRGFNNLKGTYAIYEAEFDGTPLKIMCFFTQKDNYLYAVFTGTLKDKFDENKHFLDELIVTFQYVK